MNRFLLFCLSALPWVLLCPVGLRAQGSSHASPYTVSIRHITVEQGLPARFLIATGQDATGYIWLSTQENAYRFDGQRFTALPPGPVPKQQLYSPGYPILRSDRYGQFWLMSNMLEGHQRQYLLRPGQTRPEEPLQVFRTGSFPTEAILDVAPAPDNTFSYFRTYTGTIWRQDRPGHFRRIGRFSGMAGLSDGYTYMHETGEHTLLIAARRIATQTAMDLVELDSTGQERQRYALPPNNTYRPIWKAPDGSVYLQCVYTHDAELDNRIPSSLLYRLTPDGRLTDISFNTPTLTQRSLVDANIKYDAHHGLFWIVGPHVCTAWHPQHGVIFNGLDSDSQLAGIQEFKGTFIDRTGAIWIITNDGIVLLSVTPRRFQQYLHVADAKSNETRHSIRGMIQLGNRLWVNAQDSYLVDLKTGHAQPALAHSGIDPIYTINLYPVVQDKTGTIWAAFGGLAKVDPKTLRATSFDLKLENACYSIWPDNKNRLWLGHLHGLSVFDTQQNRLLPFTQFNQFGELANNQVNGFFPDKQVGGVWVAASSGLYLLDTASADRLGGILARYSMQNKAPNQTAGPHLPFDHITFVHPDPDEAGTYWLATRGGGGLIRWNRRTGQYQQFTTKQGLSDNTIYAIYEDKHGRLWLPSNNGLMCFHRKTHQVQIYHKKDGLADEEFNFTAHYRAPDGRLFMGGLNGITAFYPDEIRDGKSILAPLLVTQYQKLDTETGLMADHFSELSQEHHIHLTPSDRLFNLSFALLDYRNLGQSRLWYRIIDWQENWVMQDRLELSINGLPSGDYTIQVRAQTINGDWASSVLSVPITVDKPVYLRIWFLLLCILVLTGIIIAVFRWRNRQLVHDKARLETEVARRTAQIEADKATIEQQAADLQANATLKSRFFANVSHEFRTPLTLLLGPLQYLSKRITDSSTQELLSAMDRNTRHLLALVNDLLDLTRIDNGGFKLDEQPGDLAQVVLQAVTNFMPQAQYNGIHLHVTGAEAPFSMLLDSQKIETVLRNLIANALRYTSPRGNIQVALSRTDTKAQIQVTDTGSGIHPDDLPHIFERYFQSNQPEKPLQGGTGIGLALCQEYCTGWGGELTVSSQLGKGSTFTITYPIRLSNQPVKPLPKTDIEVVQTLNVNALTLPTLLMTPEKTSTQSEATSIRLLVVDDNPDMLLYIQTMLSPYYELLMAQNGRNALDLLDELAPEQLPSLIISDIMMPEIDGLTLVNTLRLHPALRHIPVVLLTARVDLDSRLQALRLGVADYLTKPFYEAELLTRIQNLLRRFEEQKIWQQQVSQEEMAKTDVHPNEAGWLLLAQQVIRQNLTNPDLTISSLAEMTHVSERHLYRRTKELTGFSPNQFIQEIRLQAAYELFEKQPNALVKSVGHQVGYQKTSYFIQIFRERFGVNPGERLRQLESADGAIKE